MAAKGASKDTEVELNEEELETTRGGVAKADHQTAMAIVGNFAEAPSKVRGGAEGWAGVGAG